MYSRLLTMCHVRVKLYKYYFGDVKWLTQYYYYDSRNGTGMFFSFRGTIFQLIDKYSLQKDCFGVNYISSLLKIQFLFPIVFAYCFVNWTTNMWNMLVKACEVFGGNGACDEDFNRVDCSWDGGDCCECKHVLLFSRHKSLVFVPHILAPIPSDRSTVTIPNDIIYFASKASWLWLIYPRRVVIGYLRGWWIWLGRRGVRLPGSWWCNMQWEHRVVKLTRCISSDNNRCIRT